MAYIASTGRMVITKVVSDRALPIDAHPEHRVDYGGDGRAA